MSASAALFILVVLVVTNFLTVAVALNKSEVYASDQELDEAIKDKQRFRIVGFRNETPHGVVTRAVRGIKGADSAFAAVIEHFEDAVSNPNCFLRNNDWVDHLKYYALYRGFKPPNQACVSSTRERNTELKVSPSKLLERLQNIAGLTGSRIEDSVEKDFPKLFKNVEMPRSHRYEKDMQHCVVERVTGIRVGANQSSTWYILMGVTDDQVTKDHPDWERKFINEYVGVGDDDRFRDPLPFYILPYSPNDSVTERGYFSSTLERWSGRVGMSAVYPMVLEAVPALTHALEMGDVEVGQAIDALTPSNTAILALPMVMNMIPISLITELSSCGIFVYTIITDVLTTVPFIIKGFELIAMGSRRQVAEDTWFSGKTSDITVILETWVAECRIVRVRRVGIIFVSVGFTILFLGVLAEILSHRLRHKWIRQGTLQVGVADNMKQALFGPHSNDNNMEEFDVHDEEAAFRRQQERRLQTAVQ